MSPVHTNFGMPRTKCPRHGEPLSRRRSAVPAATPAVVLAPALPAAEAAKGAEHHRDEQPDRPEVQEMPGGDAGNQPDHRREDEDSAETAQPRADELTGTVA